MAIISDTKTKIIDIQKTPSVLSSLNSILLSVYFLNFFAITKPIKVITLIATIKRLRKKVGSAFNSFIIMIDFSLLYYSLIISNKLK
jgi:hypothetical protein